MPTGSVYELKQGEVCHVIHLESNVNEHLLYAYIEFYSVFSFLVLLSDSYDGVKINDTYCFELSQVKEVNKDIRLGLTKLDLDMPHKPDKQDWAVTERRSERFLKVCEIRQLFSESSNIVKRNLQNATVVTEDVVNRIAEEVGEMMARYMNSK